MNKNTNSLLSLENITVSFEGFLALNDLNLSLKKGDRVAAYVPNKIESVISFLACAKNGIIWSSCSPDFGVQGVVDRFKQIKVSN